MRTVGLCALLCLFTIASARAGEPMRVGAVASVHPMASDAAMATLRQGGNAVDAAVAAMLTLGVVDGHNSGIGGGCFMLIRLRDGQVVAFDGREMAPAAADRDMFLRDGVADAALSQTGALASGVPGALAVYDAALRAHGRRALADLLEPAAQIAEQGFLIDGNYAAKLAREAETLARFEGSRAILLKPDGSPYAEGERLVQRDLAATYRAVAREGIGHVYGGAFARRVEAWMAEHGGLLTAADFAGYEVVRREPLRVAYRGFEVIGFPPPSSGGVHVAQILAMLERFDLASLDEASRITAIANAMQLAFADRAWWLGDPDFARVPRGLVDAAYLRERSAAIAVDRAIQVSGHGAPAALTPHFTRERHTTHVSVVDAEGNAVAVTATVNTTFGSKVIVPGTGVILNNQMDDFSAQPGAPNAFGLIGAEANAVAPRKRPLSSMSPTIVVRDGRPVAVLGAAGGPRIISQVVCVLVNWIDLDLPPTESMRRGRVHHQWRPDSLWIENTVPAEVRSELARRGFSLNEVAPVGATNLIVLDASGAEAVSEPRLRGKAIVE